LSKATIAQGSIDDERQFEIAIPKTVFWV